ncbi:MAG: phospholipid carrier-dependent glycosyltransferase [Kineosporiaceae bacterium]
MTLAPSQPDAGLPDGAVDVAESGSPSATPTPGRSRLEELQLRLLGLRASDRFWGWVGPLVVTLIGGALRFYRLGFPTKLNFDETYYVKYAASLLFWGIPRAWRDDWPNGAKPDDIFNAGTPNVFQQKPDFIVHPPLGSWMIAIGEKLFGITDSFGWRFMPAVCGTLSILMLARITRRMLGSTLLGTTAGLLLAVEGNHYVMSRTAILDVFVMFWALAGFGFIIIDRDRARAALARRIAEGKGTASLLGPSLGWWRPWRLLAAVSLGLCCGVKWSGVPFFAAFALATVLWDIGARRAIGQRHWFSVGLLRDGWGAFWQMVPTAVLAYAATWSGWFASARFGQAEPGGPELAGYKRFWGTNNPTTTEDVVKHFNWAPDWFRSWLSYHHEAWTFHVGLTDNHPYQSNPWSWIITSRPTAFFYEDRAKGVQGCKVEQCASAITPIGNPVIWWGGTIAIAVLIFCWLLRRDWRAGAILCGLAGSWLFWFREQERTVFQFYAVAMTPWVVLGLTYAIGLLLGKSGDDPVRRRRGIIAAGTIVALACLAFAFFFPVLSGLAIPKSQWQWRMWLPSWI